MIINVLSKNQFSILIFIMIISISSYAQIGGWNPELEKEAKEELQIMLKRSPKLKIFYEDAYAYVVFPTITKGAIGIGGAGGKGVAYQNHKVVGTSSLKQATIGLQAGGQQYSEVIFFENKASFNHFKNGKLKFNAQASAVAIDKGASVDVAYKDGVAVFTNSKGGLMFEGSIGGQHFTYKSVE